MTERISSETQVSFGEWINKNGIKVALFDLDDTLFNTQKLFSEQFQKYFSYARECIPDLDIDKFGEEFRGLNDFYYRSMGVSIKKLDRVVADLSKKYNSEYLKDGISHLYAIYNLAPDIFDGSVEVLELCKKSGLRIGAVTHANDAWTEIKLRDIRHYFDHVKVIDMEIYKNKTSEHWSEAIVLFGVDPSAVLVTGDSATNDIVASHKIGVRHLVHVPARWSVNAGSLPEGVYEIDKIGDLPAKICQKN